MKTVLFTLLLCPLLGWAQSIKITPADLERKRSFLVLKDGSVLRGQILRQDSTLITVRKPNGNLSFVETEQVVQISANRDRQFTTQLTDNISTVYVLKDNVRIPGTFVRQDSVMITVRKQNGQLTYFEPELLVRVDTIRSDNEQPIAIESEKPTFINRFSPFMALNPTAYNPEKGRLYYRNTLLLLNEVHYGITRNWSVGASLNPFFVSMESENLARETIFSATYRLHSKLTFPIGEQFRFGINATYQPQQRNRFFTMNDQLVLHGLLSFGNSQRNATLGYGQRILFSSLANYNKQSYVSAGLMHKLSGNLTFISDNIFYLNSYYTGTSANLSMALRFDRSRHAFDLGVFSAVIPHYSYYATPPYSRVMTKAYFFPYLAYNLLIGK